MTQEKTTKALSGYPMAAFELILLAGWIYAFAIAQPIIGTTGMVIWLFLLFGFFIV